MKKLLFILALALSTNAWAQEEKAAKLQKMIDDLQDKRKKIVKRLKNKIGENK